MCVLMQCIQKRVKEVIEYIVYSLSEETFKVNLHTYLSQSTLGS